MPDLVIALDVSTIENALRIVDAVGDGAKWYKVGPVLHVEHGQRLLDELQQRGKRVFLDLKWHDIPNTVAAAVRSLSLRPSVELVTVHLLGGRKMLKAAADAYHTSVTLLPRVLGVGIVTSLSAQEFGDSLGRPIEDAADEQERLMRIGLEAGLDGFVCAASEAAAVRQFAGPDVLLVTPGIRRAGDSTGDQVRTATPGEAVRAGANLLVIGRPVTEASDPAAAVAAIREEMGA